MKKIIAALFLLMFAVPAAAVGTLIVSAATGIAWGSAAWTIGYTVAAMAINFAVSTIVTRVFGKKPPVKEGDVVNINRGGYNQFRDKNDFLDKRDYVQKQLLDPRQRENYNELKQRLQDINYAGRKLGYIK